MCKLYGYLELNASQRLLLELKNILKVEKRGLKAIVLSFITLQVSFFWKKCVIKRIVLDVQSIII